MVYVGVKWADYAFKSMIYQGTSSSTRKASSQDLSGIFSFQMVASLQMESTCGVLG